MKTKDTVEEVNEQIAKLKSNREHELAEIQKHIDEESRSLMEATKAMNAATDMTDLEAYECAKAEKTRAETALEMYSARYSKLQKLEFISEEESDAIIASLRSRDSELTLEFQSDLDAALETVKDLLKSYERKKNELNSTVQTWTRDIHHNYFSPTSTFKETGTHRSPRPIPVNAGLLCPEFNITKEYLERLRTLGRGI